MATIARATVYAVLALIWVTPVGGQLATPEEAIRAQVQGFYRDDRDNRWPDGLGLSGVGKIRARGAEATRTQAGLAARPGGGGSACVRWTAHADARSVGRRDGGC